MERYYTVMLVPDKQEYVRTIKIPTFALKAGAVILSVIILITGVFIYDYWSILQQVYENKHLSLENKQLREQLQLFQMKLNTMTKDLERIYTFEKKLRIISGLDKEKLTSPYFEELQNKQGSAAPNTPNQYEDLMKRDFYTQLGTDAPKDNEEYKKIRSDFERMILHSFGVKDKYEIAKVLSPLASRSLDLADDFSLFEFTYKNLNKSVHSIESSVNELDEYLLDQDSILKSTPLTLPVNGWITSYYGPRVNPVSGNLQMHEGLDVGAPNGAPIHSAADGIVIFSGTKPGFGQHVQIDHGYGIETIYAHSSRVLVKKGDKIVRGDLIAQVGSTGHSTGPHLHYEVRVNGVAVDPYYFLLDQ